MVSTKALGTCIVLAAGVAAAAEATAERQVRLLSPLASYSLAGTPFRARVLGPVLPGGSSESVPAGTIVEGHVRSAHSVRFGIRRERAGLDLEFDSCRPPAASPVACQIELLAVDTARERVTRDNHIQGILAAGHPHSLLNGVWLRPASGFAQRSAGGLVGTFGFVQNHIAATPAGALLSIASRLVLMRLPDPEIQLPAGTDLIVRITSRVPPGGQRGAPREETVPAPAAAWVRGFPARIKRPNGVAVQDLVNLVLAGSQEEVENAFETAGWFRAEPPGARAFVRTYGAFAAMSTYPNLPVSPLLHGGRLPDLVFEKSLNSVSKRHHIRLWKAEFAGTPMWFGAATHDTGIGFAWKRIRFTHRIDPIIDKERAKVLDDLSDAGCVAAADAVERPALASRAGENGDVVTDGALYYLKVRKCGRPEHAAPELPGLHRGLLTRSVRRAVLETRYYIIRGNVFYWGFRAGRWSLRRGEGSND